jgi:undecaprenyl-diphosphatase
MERVNKYSAKIFVSMIPIGIVGLFFMSEVESFYNGNVVFIGGMLLITASLLIITHLVKSQNKDINYRDAFIIGLAQAAAVYQEFHDRAQQ